MINGRLNPGDSDKECSDPIILCFEDNKIYSKRDIVLVKICPITIKLICKSNCDMC